MPDRYVFLWGEHPMAALHRRRKLKSWKYGYWTTRDQAREDIGGAKDPVPKLKNTQSTDDLDTIQKRELRKLIIMANILVVDDDVLFAKAQGEFLRRSGHTATTAANGKEAMDLVARNDFDLVITDLNMPEKEGFETISELRRTTPKIKIIAMSGGTVLIDAKDSLSMARMFGASLTLAKPFSGQALIEAVKQVLSL